MGLRARKQRLPLWKLAGGAKEKCPLYTTEGGWLHIDIAELVDEAVPAKAKGFTGSKVKIGARGAEDHAASPPSARRWATATRS